jgi:hypothetical protein
MDREPLLTFRSRSIDGPRPESGGSNRHDGRAHHRKRAAIACSLAAVLTGCDLSFPYPLGSDPSDAGDSSAPVVDAALDAGRPDPCTIALDDARVALALPATGALPNRGETFREPEFGTCMRRVTEPIFRNARSFGSALANADRTMMAVNDDHFESWVYDLATGQKTTYDLGIVASGAMWDASSPTRITRLLFMPPRSISDENLTGGALDPVARFDLDPDLAPELMELDRVSSNDFGSWMSADRTRAVIPVHDVAPAAALVTYERTDSSFARAGLVRAPMAEIDWAVISPSGDYVVACWLERGMIAYRFDLGAEAPIDGDSQCSDERVIVGLRDRGEAFVYAVGSRLRAVDLGRLLSGDALGARYTLETTFGHSAGFTQYVRLAAPARKRGWIVLLFHACVDERSERCPAADGWGQDRIVAFEVPDADARTTPRAYSLAWHRSGPEELIAVDPDFRHVWFASRWGVTGLQSIFEIDLGESLPD